MMCAQCDQSIDVHMRCATGHISSRLKRSFSQVSHLLRLWFPESVKWATDRPCDTADDHVIRLISSNLDLVKAALHHLASSWAPDDASSPFLGLASAVTKEMAAKGIGDIGSVSVPTSL